MSDAVTLDSVFILVKQLPLAEKVRLIEWIAPQIERELLPSQRVPRKSLRGLWRGLGITESDTALHLNLPLISRDRKIRLSAVDTIW